MAQEPGRQVDGTQPLLQRRVRAAPFRVLDEVVPHAVVDFPVASPDTCEKASPSPPLAATGACGDIRGSQNYENVGNLSPF
jgi:hypothetical protein